MTKIVIFDQSKPTSISFGNGNKTSIQPILKSNSTFFMFNNIFCEMNIKKIIHWRGGRGGNVGTVLISSWKCIYYSIYLDIQVYYLDIQAISTLLCLLLVLDVELLIFI